MAKVTAPNYNPAEPVVEKQRTEEQFKGFVSYLNVAKERLEVLVSRKEDFKELISNMNKEELHSIYSCLWDTKLHCSDLVNIIDQSKKDIETS